MQGSSLEAVKQTLDSTTFYAWNAFKRTKAGMGAGHYKNDKDKKPKTQRSPKCPSHYSQHRLRAVGTCC